VKELPSIIRKADIAPLIMLSSKLTSKLKRKKE
jgi:hypothetical protein